jgi:hypothetical protein
VQKELENRGLNSTPNKKRGRPSKRAKLGSENNSQSRENTPQTSKFNSQAFKNNTNNISNKNSSNKFDKKATTKASDDAQQQSPSSLLEKLSSLSEKEQSLYRKLRTQDKEIFLAWSPSQRSPYVNYIYSCDKPMPINITPAVIDTVNAWEDMQTSPEEFRAMRTWALEQEKDAPKEQQRYSKIGFKIWHTREVYQAWASSVEAKDMQRGKSARRNQNAGEINTILDKIEAHTKHVGYGDTIKANLVMDGSEQMIKIHYDGKYAGTVQSLDDWKTIFVNNLICDDKLPEGFDKQVNLAEISFKDIFKAIAIHKLPHDAPTMEDLHKDPWGTSISV